MIPTKRRYPGPFSARADRPALDGTDPKIIRRPMRRTTPLALAILSTLLLGFGACEQTSAPVRRNILGSWQSQDLPGATARITVAETARSIDGAGGWVEGEETFAFRVFGALAREEVSLYFDFTERPDLSFQGFFRDEDRMEGVLYGGAYQEQPVSFSREALPR